MITGPSSLVMNQVTLRNGVVDLNEDASNNGPVDNIVYDNPNSFGKKKKTKNATRKSNRKVNSLRNDLTQVDGASINQDVNDFDLIAGTVPFDEDPYSNDEDVGGNSPGTFTRNLIEREAHLAVASQFGN